MLKDHYKTLGVLPAATAAELKAAYRALAARYHPDKAGDNPFAESHFKEIGEAYRLLSDAEARRAYDEERWLRGISNRARDKQRISPEWMLAEAEKLAAHLKTIDGYRMNHAALRDYILLLLGDAHLGVWKAEATPAQTALLSRLIIEATQKQRSEYFGAVAARLAIVTDDDAALTQQIARAAEEKRRAEHRARLLPLLVLMIAALICLLILTLYR